MRAAVFALALALGTTRTDARNETRAELFAERATFETVRVIHGSGGGWPAEDSVRMMQPYWDAQNAGGTLLQINTNSGPGEVDNVTSALAKALNLDFELLTGLSGTECPAGAMDENIVNRINNAAGIWFGGGLPGRAVSCLFGYDAQAFGVNTPPDRMTPVLEALQNHPLVGGISAGAMMQPSAPLLHGNEISYSPSFHESADIMRIGKLMMNNRGSGLVVDPFTIHSHFSERGYQGMMPISIIQNDGLEWAAGFDEGGVGHYFPSNGDLLTVGAPSRGTGTFLYSDCSGDEDAQECQLHFMSDGDVWNARTHEFDVDGSKSPCTGQLPSPEGSDCVFNRAIGADQNFRRIAKAAAAGPVGSTVSNFHTEPRADRVVEADFTVTDETQAWCDEEGTVVSFINLRLSQNRNGPITEPGAPRPNCAGTDHRVFTGFE